MLYNTDDGNLGEQVHPLTPKISLGIQTKQGYSEPKALRSELNSISQNSLLPESRLLCMALLALPTQPCLPGG